MALHLSDDRRNRINQLHRTTEELSHAKPGEVACPDPSVHVKDTQLQELASIAALQVTEGHKESTSGSRPRSLAGSTVLTRAKPKDLPGYPVVGVDFKSSAGKAAHLANANRKSYQPWKPESSSSAEQAALLAHKDETSAAGAAMRRSSQNVGVGEEAHRRALQAATGAVSTRPQPGTSMGLSKGAAQNALNAATIANQHSRDVIRDAPHIEMTALEAARVQHLGQNVSREMFTDHPPVAIEVEEKRHQDALRASAISMAKQMYKLQQKHIDEMSSGVDSRAAARSVHIEQGSVVGTNNDDHQNKVRQQAQQYLLVQEAAKKLAAERLARIYQEDDLNLYSSYYGYNMDSRPHSRLSLQGRNRRRASSESYAPVAHPQNTSRTGHGSNLQSIRRPRSQTGKRNEHSDQVDPRKRQKDRDALLQAAQRKVQAQLRALDERVFNETGKAPQSIQQEWETKAHARATANREARLTNHGKVYVGGGKYVDQSDINAVAAARLKPALDEISDAAERQRAREIEAQFDRAAWRRLNASYAWEPEAQIGEDKGFRATEDKRIYKDNKLRFRNARTESPTPRLIEMHTLATEQTVASSTMEHEELYEPDRTVLMTEATALPKQQVIESETHILATERTAAIPTAEAESLHDQATPLPAAESLSTPAATSYKLTDDPIKIADRVLSSPVDDTFVGSTAKSTITSGEKTNLDSAISPSRTDASNLNLKANEAESGTGSIRSLISKLRRRSRTDDSSYIIQTKAPATSTHSQSTAAAASGGLYFPSFGRLSDSDNADASMPVSSRIEDTLAMGIDYHGDEGYSVIENRDIPSPVSDMSSHGEQFEEARDTFEDKQDYSAKTTTTHKSGPVIPPIMRVGSPGRDSRFQENL